MMPIIDECRFMDATYWAPVLDGIGRPVFDRYNQPTFHPPVELKVFWIDKTELIMGKSGQVQSKAQVILGDDVSSQGLLFKGLKSEVPAGFLSDPKKFSAALEIQKTTKIRTLQNDQWYRDAWL